MTHTYFYSYSYYVVFNHPVWDHALMLRCIPYQSEYQCILESHIILPPGFWKHQSADCWGNATVGCGNRQLHKSMIYESVGIVKQEDSYHIHDSSPSAVFLLPTTLTSMPSNEIVSDSPEIICQFVHEVMNYKKGATSNLTPASQAMLCRHGVCQDYAHVMIGLCRSNNLPARYVAGMMQGEGETHAWVEVWKDGEWTAYDPTHNKRISHGYIKIAHGRDAADCQVCRGTYKGNATETSSVRVIVHEL